MPGLASIRDADDEGEQPSECEQRRIVGAPDWGATTVTPDRHDLVHHHLGLLAETCSFVGGESQTIEGGRALSRRQQADEHAVGFIQKIRLNDERRTGLPIVTTYRDRDEVASPHVLLPSQSAAASTKSSASRSSGAPFSSKACRCASSRKPGACGSGTHTRNSFMPLARRVAR